jgi:hypothetical protein
MSRKRERKRKRKKQTLSERVYILEQVVSTLVDNKGVHDIPGQLVLVKEVRTPIGFKQPKKKLTS